MRLVLFASLASLLLSGCTRDNPAFGAITATGGETLGPIGDGDGDASADEVSTSDPGDGDGDQGDGDGDGEEPLLPDCVDGSQWLAIDIYEDNFVHFALDDPSGCALGSSDPGGTLPPDYGPSGIPCTAINYGKTGAHWLTTTTPLRTGYLARLELVDLTGRGIKVSSAYYEFHVAWTFIVGEVLMMLAPIRDDQWAWTAGQGDGEEIQDGESSFAYRSAPDTWGGSNAFSALDNPALLYGTWFENSDAFEVEVPVGRIQAWLDQEGRFDPGFMLWSDVAEPYLFGIFSAEGEAPPALWIEACFEG